MALMLASCLAACRVHQNGGCNSPAPAPKAWTVMIFMAADPGLEPFAQGDLAEMEQIGSGADLNLIVQLETSGRVQRFEIEPGSRASCNSGDAVLPSGAAGVQSFVTWAQQAFPARQRALVLWGHSRGVADSLAVAPEEIKAEGPRTHLWLPRVSDLRRALDAAGAVAAPLDLIGFDSCFLGNVEAAYQLRQVARFMVASEDAIDRSGWNYASALRPLRGGDSGREFGAHIVRHADESISSGELVLLDLGQSDAMSRDLARLITTLRSAVTRNDDDRRALSILLRQVASVRVRQFIDLEDVGHTVAHAFDADVQQHAERLLATLRRFVIARGGHSATGGRYGGVSIYYPHVLAPSRAPGETNGRALLDAVADETSYRQLDFVRDTGWGELVEQLRP